MNKLTRCGPTGNSNTVASVGDLATDLNKCKAWLATRHGHTNRAKICHVFIKAIYAGRKDICKLISDSGRIDNEAVMSTEAIAHACCSGQLSVVQLIVSRYHPSTQHLYSGLATACTHGHVETVAWLLSEMKLAHDIRIRWLLAAASARGDISTVKLLSVQAGVTSTEAMSHALRVACYQSRVKVIDWLMTHTTADVSLCGELDAELGSMTSLTAACCKIQKDILAMLINCGTPHTVNIQCGRHNDSALHYAISFNNLENWKHSIHSACAKDNINDVSTAVFDTNVSAIDYQGNTPLHLVCQNGSVKIAQLLLSLFARVDITDDDRHTPTEIAKYYKDTELVSYMSQLLDASNYTPSSSIGAVVRATSSVTRATADVTVSDVSIIASDVRSTVQLCAQRNATGNKQRQRHSVTVAASNRKSCSKIV